MTQNKKDEEPEIDLEEDDDEEEYDLETFLEQEGLTIVPNEFLDELMVLMEAHVIQQADVTKEELDVIIDRLEELIGEDGMMDLSLEDIVGWVVTLKD